MTRRLAWLTTLILFVGCNPNIPQEPAPAVVQARFDPAASPPVVPTPNDLARDPATGMLNITVPPNASPADQEFAAFLNMLNGFPSTSTGVATFTGQLDPSTVNSGSIKAVDLTQGTEVQGLRPFTSDTGNADAPARVSVPSPAMGWTTGNTIALAIVGGPNGAKGANGETVAGTATWAFVRAENPLVTCEDLTSPDCRPTTAIIPSTETDPAARLADQTQSAIALERLRRLYKPAIDAFVAVTGVQRQDIALLWTFTISTTPSMEFNPAAQPPAVPTPNDLAIDPDTGLVNIPADPNAPEAQQQFTRDYLNTLDGFPISSVGMAHIMGADLDPTTVNASTILFQNLSTNGVETPTPTIAFDPAGREITVSPPEGGWPKGGRFAVVIVGGPNGVKTSSGGEVVGSEVWALVRSPSPLVTCADLTSPECASTLTVTALSQSEAVGLEQLRRLYAPLLDQLAAQGVPRDDVAVLWTFTVVSLPEATFEPTANIIPFPNNLLLNDGVVNLPIPPGAPQLLQDIIAGLNTLNGFSLTAPIVSENSDTLGAIDVGTVDPATLEAGSGFLKLTEGGTAPQVVTCLNCASSLLPDGSAPSSPQQIQFVPQVPLDEESTYGAFLDTDLKASDGKTVVATPTFALLRVSAPLVDENGVSQVEGVSDAEAMQLEPARQALQPLMDALDAAGTPRSQVSLAWAFTTQTAASALRSIYELPEQVGSGGGLPSVPDYVSDQTAAILASTPTPQGNIGRVYVGSMSTLYLLNGPAGTLVAPPPATTQRIPFLLTLPNTAAPEGGFPVVVFQHGLTRSRVDLLAIADALAAGGRASIAIDAPWHGERTTCVGSAAVLGASSDDAACADPSTQMCEPTSGRCVARSPASRPPCEPIGATPGDIVCGAAGLGACVSDGAGGNVCEGGDFLRSADTIPVISGWNFLNLNSLFGTRDNFRQPMADIAQLLRVVSDTSTTGNLNSQLPPDATLNVNEVDFVGVSLGGILGTLAGAASPQIRRLALNTAGGQLSTLFLESPAFTPQRNAFLATLASQGITPGTPAFDSFIGIAQWILDPADPVNAAYDIENGPDNPANREAFIQWIEADQVIPNSATMRLIAAANRVPDANQIGTFQFTPSTGELPPVSRHGFLLNFTNPTITSEGQSQVVNFLNTGATP